MPLWAAWLFPSLADVMFVALLGLALGLRGHQLFNTDGDLARHLAVGRQILATGTIPTLDLFSFTKGGAPFVPYEWLSEVIFALAEQQLGLSGVAVVAATVAALPFLLLVRWTVRDGANPLVAIALVTAGALAASMHWLARPHLFTLLLALFWTRALVRHRATGSLWPLAALPPMMALWANLHGGFLVGFVILGLFLVGGFLDRVRGSSDPGALTPRSLLEVAVAGVLSLAATGLNPAGYALLPHVSGYFRSQFLVDNTQEYLSPNFHDLGPQLFLVLLLVAVVVLALTPRPISFTELGMLLVWAAFSLYSARNIPLFVVTCLPIVVRLASEGMGYRQGGIAGRLAATERRMGGPLLPLLAVIAALLIARGSVAGLHPQFGFDPAKFPVQALAKAGEAGARGKVFNYFPWGGYILYAGYPQYRVFIDGQTDFYGEQLMRDYLEVANLGPDWETVLDRYGIDWVLFPHRSPLTLMLLRTEGWRLVYQDETADIFSRER